MTTWICDGCGLEHPDSAAPPPHCVLASAAVGDEERGDLGPHGRWTTHAELARQPHRIVHRDHGRGVHSLRREPRLAIGHWSFLVQTPHGNLLWDPPAYLDDEIAGLVGELGGIAAIATSHPHMFAAQITWSHAFGRVPVLVNELDREWLPRPDPVVRFWTGHAEPLPGLELIHTGGHMRGSCVARTPDGTLLSGDTIAGCLDPNWVSFQRNVPRHVPLSPTAVRRIVDTLASYDYDRLYTLGGDTLDHDAKQTVESAATRHIRWVSGEFDHLI
ncbi:hydrolase [Nocardia sp. CDC159]|uniref:Hydrolase n=1 Tax=Nocardia pulmonis TaxID=2951408 RepID=A0A9X2EHZ6_9NOCA|nr:MULTISPECIES: hydrolase [Nocardia]MCM6778366.1 hydrolase [Nocardia pulmonis]MCM6791238.1 hydrolase [Nocardia sp. CDC159]